MIGQGHLLNRLYKILENDDFPALLILEGQKGSGKKTVIQKMMKCSPQITFITVDDLGVESIRYLIQMAYTNKGYCYILSDADSMSLAARNALLKVTEEPPNKSCFIMTLEDINNTLETIKSRATVLTMDRYSKDELFVYLESLKTNLSNEEKKMVLDWVETPGEVNEIVAVGPKELMDYVDLVIDNMTEVSTANAFKIPSKVAIKDSDAGYDVGIFWKVLCRRCVGKATSALWSAGEKNDMNMYLDWVTITSSYLRQLRVKAVNKAMLVDNWIIDIREAINGYK